MATFVREKVAQLIWLVCRLVMDMCVDVGDDMMSTPRPKAISKQHCRSWIKRLIWEGDAPAGEHSKLDLCAWTSTGWAWLLLFVLLNLSFQYKLPILDWSHRFWFYFHCHHAFHCYLRLDNLSGLRISFPRRFVLFSKCSLLIYLF